MAANWTAESADPGQVAQAGKLGGRRRLFEKQAAVLQDRAPAAALGAAQDFVGRMSVADVETRTKVAPCLPLEA